LLREQTQDMGVILVEQCWEILNFGLKRVIVCSVFKPFRNGEAEYFGLQLYSFRFIKLDDQARVQQSQRNMLTLTGSIQ